MSPFIQALHDLMCIEAPIVAIKSGVQQNITPAWQLL